VQLDVSLEQETVWLTQAQMCDLFEKSKRTVSEHIRNIFKEGELAEDLVVRNFRITAAGGNICGLPGEIPARCAISAVGDQCIKTAFGARL